MSIQALEEQVRARAITLGNLQREAAQEYVRLTVTGMNTWTAQKMTAEQFDLAITVAKAEYEIAMEALRRNTYAGEPAR